MEMVDVGTGVTAQELALLLAHVARVLMCVFHMVHDFDMTFLLPTPGCQPLALFSYALRTGPHPCWDLV